MKLLLAIFCSFLFFISSANTGRESIVQVDSIFVCKSKKEMTLYSQGTKVKTYVISIGANEKGHKQQQGDDRTPEGLYIINDKNANSRYYRNLGISYPDRRDVAEAARRKVDPGGDIKIHGYADKFGSVKEMYVRYSSTWGCIGVCNADMKEIFSLVVVGAKVLIVP
jgi:murein L,D-transpeptidase YafK